MQKFLRTKQLGLLFSHPLFCGCCHLAEMRAILVTSDWLFLIFSLISSSSKQGFWTRGLKHAARGSHIAHLGSISSTCLQAAFTRAHPESAKICLTWLSFWRFWDLPAQKLCVKHWWNWNLMWLEPIFASAPSCLKKYCLLQKWSKVIIALLLPRISLNPWYTLYKSGILKPGYPGNPTKGEVIWWVQQFDYRVFHSWWHVWVAHILVMSGTPCIWTGLYVMLKEIC